jgi:NADH-quinone oxidoreductase subunit N
MLTLALVLITVGFAFKIAAVPFHMWTPDVYEGAPTPLTAFMSVGPKVAGFAVIMRVYMTSFSTLVSDWSLLFELLAILTMIVGNVIAVAQTSVKRMLAYSSISHAGYLLIGVVAAGSAGALSTGDGGVMLASESMTAVMVYLFAYMFMNMGAFAIIISLGTADNPGETLQDFAGLARRRPGSAMLMTVLLLSLAGIPPTFGFIGKLYIFKAAIQTGNTHLAIVGVLASVVAAFYYIRVVVYMYMREPEGEIPPDFAPAGSTMYAIIATTAFTLFFGILPGAIIGLAKYSVEQLLA